MPFDNIATQSFLTGASSHDVDIPAGWNIESGDLLGIAIYTRESTIFNPVTPTGFTNLARRDDGFSVFDIHYKSCDGTEEGTTVTVEMGSSETAIAIVFHKKGWSSIEASSFASASGSFIANPPSITPTWGAQAGTQFVTLAVSQENTTVDNYPANYTDDQTSVDMGAADEPAIMAMSSREADTATEDPDNYDFVDAANTVAVTIAIEPAAGATYTLTAEQGSYSVTGQTTGLLRTLRLISEQGSYTYTGQTASLLKTYLLAAEQGTYTIVGADGELLETFILEAESGNYSLTGQETQFFRTLKLIAEQGTYTASGQTTSLLRNLLLTAEQGSYSLSGQDAIISAVSNYILTAESGSYSLTGNDTAFLRKLILEAGSGNYTLSGQQTQLLRKLLLSAASGNYSLTGQDIALTVEDSPEILILMSAIVSSLELDSTITTELDLDSSV